MEMKQLNKKSKEKYKLPFFGPKISNFPFSSLDRVNQIMYSDKKDCKVEERLQVSRWYRILTSRK